LFLDHSSSWEESLSTIRAKPSLEPEKMGIKCRLPKISKPISYKNIIYYFLQQK
jgi:hypothetical protein